MERLEELRQQNALKIAELESQARTDMITILAEQTKIAIEHAKTAEALRELSERSDNQGSAFNKQTTTFNKSFVLLGFIALVLALGQIFYPSGISGIHSPFAAIETPIVVVLPTTQPLPTVAPDKGSP